MKRAEKKYRNMFAGILVMMFIPLVQMQFRIVNERPLRGYIEKVPEPSFSIASWFEESFQAKAEKYLNQHFGFRGWPVRINNQIKYSFFNEVFAKGVITGKENYLYEESYIEAYYGTDFIGEEAIEEQVKKFRVVQDSLKKHGVDLVLVMAPGKASYYPEYIPDRYDTVKGKTNHEVYVEKANLYEINFIDFSTWFINMKDSSPYYLYPKTGIHWSYYGMNLAMDSLVRYLERLKGIDMPDMVWDTIEIDRKLRGVDRDIEEGMNLLFPLDNHPMPYPKINIIEEGKTKPSTIIIADSYYWQPHNAGYSKSIFGQGEFWFYFNRVYPSRAGNKATNVSDLNLLDEIYKRDIVIVMCTEPFLKRNFWGFVDECYNDLQNQDNSEAEVLHIMDRIRNDINWSEKIKDKAIAKNISFEEMLRMDAEYIYRVKQVKDTLN